MASDEVSVSTLLLFFGVVSFIVYKAFFASPDTLRNSNGAQDTAARTQQLEQSCDQLTQMFPQVDRRIMLWNLRRNNNNTQLTTELALAGRLSQPPPSFQPAPATPTATAPQPVASQETTSKPDLITRYNLHDKIGEPSLEESPESAVPKGKAWSSNKEDRQALLKKRREAMILEARRKMEAKMAAQKVESST